MDLQTILFANAYARKMEHSYFSKVMGRMNPSAMNAERAFKTLFHVIEASGLLDEYRKVTDEWEVMPITEWREKFEKVV